MSLRRRFVLFAAIYITVVFVVGWMAYSIDTISVQAATGGYAERFGLYRVLTFSLFVILALTFYIVVRAAQWISSPIGRLTEGSRRISEGDFAFRIDLDRDDEFGSLASSFNEMAAALGESHNRLKAKLLESETLMEVSQAENSSLELGAILSSITAIVAARMNKDVCSIYLFTEDRKALVLRATTGLAASAVGVARLAIGEGIVGAAAREMRPVVVADVRSDSRFKDLPETKESEYLSLLALPILREGSCLGVITIQSRDVYEYSGEETAFLTLISHNAGSAIRNARLYDSIRRRLQRQRMLHELGMAINSILDLDRLLHDVCMRTSQLLNAEGAVVRLIEGDHLIIKASYGLPPGVETMRPLALGEGIAGIVAMEGRPLNVENADSLGGHVNVPGVDAKSVLAVPLRAGAVVIGTIGLYNKSINGADAAFDIDDIETMSSVGAMSAIAIENARLYREEKLREKEVRMAGHRLETLFESVQGGIITIGRDLAVRSANRFVERWIGGDVDSIIGRHCSEIRTGATGIIPVDTVVETFETGNPRAIDEQGDLDGDPLYLQMTTYPMRNDAGEIEEVILFLLDITERVRNQKDMLVLYSEVSQTKKYLESLIDNSADAIITTDLSGHVMSWNKGAERIYWYSADEVLRQPIPVLPEFLLPAEAENTELIKRKETLRDIETLRRRKDGTLIEVSVTLSPVIDEYGNVIGVSGISRDISDKRRTEQELTRRNQELSRLLFISNAMRSTLDLHRLLRMTLTAVTMSDGLGFNRALLMEVDSDRRVLRGLMGVGPGTLEDAWRIWGELAMARKSLENIMDEIASQPVARTSFLDRLAQNLEIPIHDDSDSILATVVREKKPLNVPDARSDSRVDPILVQQLGTEAFALIPLLSQDKVVGVLWVDNLFNRRPISDDDLRFLAAFGNHVASAIEGARLFEKVSMAEAEMENIFESISDMVYFNDRDFNIKKVNKAVLQRIGLPESQIVGRKCYEVFHGTDEPFHRCPHSKTIQSGKAFIEEMENTNLGGVFMVSSSPIRDLSGELIGTVHISRDISDARRLNEKLKKAEKMAALGEMAAKIAHEIRNPLTSIGGFARRLEKQLDGKLKNYATIMVDSVAHLELLLKDILGFVRETQIILMRGDVVEIMDQIISLFSPSLKEKNISIEKRYQDISLEVPLDSNKIREALTNLITNASQAMEKGGVISVGIWRTDRDAVIEVRDTGYGMSETTLKHLFDPFFTTKMTGTGLGLAITHRVIELHRGRIEVETELGTGTAFRIYLPLKEE